MAALLTATVVAGAGPVLVFLWPAPPKGQKKGSVKVTLQSSIDSMQNGDAIKFDAPKSPNTAFIMADGGGDNAPGDLAFGGFITRDLNGKLHCLAINCSHLGCSVAVNSADKSFDCPCHGSRFHMDGTVLHGPAAYPLSNLTWKQEDPTTISVDGLTLGF